MEEIFAKGRRSNVYLTTFKNKKAVVKKLKPGSEAFWAINDEINWLKKLNKYKIGPKIYSFKDNEAVIEFIEGERIIEFLLHAGKKDIIKKLSEVFRQCRLLDEMGISKEEMQNPYKHVLIGKKVVMIDFERCHYTEKPKNVTQFSQFLMSSRISKILESKGIKIDKPKAIRLLKEYRANPGNEAYNRILKIMLH